MPQKRLPSLVLWHIWHNWRLDLPFGLHWKDLPDMHHDLCYPYRRWICHHVLWVHLGIVQQCHPSASERCPDSSLVWMEHVKNGTHQGACWTSWAVMLPRLVHSEKCFVSVHFWEPPVNTWAISSSVGALWFSLIVVLFRSFGLRQIFSLPFGFFG